MAGRRPLSAKNAEPSRGGVKAKKERYKLLSRQALVETLTNIFKDVSPLAHVTICEEDLLKPTPDKAQQVYFAILNAMCCIQPDAFRQSSFRAFHAEHPELRQDMTYMIRFLRVMRRFMENCLVDDFQLTDLCEPDSKRLCRHLSAFINQVKFVTTYMHSGLVVEYHDATAQLTEELHTVQEQNAHLRETLDLRERQRSEEQGIEEELRQKIGQQELEMQALQQHQASLQQHHQALFDQKAMSEEALAELNQKLEKWTLRVEDLRKQIISSPERLKSRLTQLQQEVEEMKSTVKRVEGILRSWESVVSRAQQVPPTLTALNEDLQLLARKVERKKELQGQVQYIEDHIIRQKQALREAAAKLQNLQFHLKLVGEEGSQVPYDDQGIPHSRAMDDLERDVSLLGKEVQKREEAEVHMYKEIEQQRNKLAERKAAYEKMCREMEDTARALNEAFTTHRRRSSHATQSQ